MLAEGVETSDQKDLLTRLGCNTLLGFDLNRPQDAIQAGRKWLRLPRKELCESKVRAQNGRLVWLEKTKVLVSAY